jgi:pre-rRNA-processing protein TSR1
MPGHHHRAGGLRQTNKKNKRSKSSKRSITKAAGGKVMTNKNSAAHLATHGKASRNNTKQQKLELKRQELLRKKRGLDGLPPPPRVIGIISLGSNVEIEDRLRSFILEGADQVVRTHLDGDATVTCKFDVHKKDGTLNLLTCRSAFAHYGEGDDAAVLAALDLARVCDILLLVIDGNGSRIESNILEIDIGGDDPSTSTNKTSSGQDWDHLITERGDRILTAIKGQGLPTPVTVLAQTEKDAIDDDRMTMVSMKSLRRSGIKRHLDLRKYVTRFTATEFGSGMGKVVEVDLTCLDEDEEDMDPDPESLKTPAAALVRNLCSMSCSPSRWVANSPRSYVLSDKHQYDATTRELHITGYVRGVAPLDIHSLIHVPNLGTFACKSLIKAAQPLAREKKEEDMNEAGEVLLPDVTQRETLQMFATPDALDGEQNLIGFDEASDGDDNEDSKEQEFARPAGWSDYQSAWLDAVDEDGKEGGADADHGELAEELNKKSSRNDGMSVGTDYMDLDDVNEVSPEEKRALMEQRRKENNAELSFPDEVEVGDDVNAADRFARYRSLKSFRKSFWDPKENLPDSYASIYHFSSFKSTQRSVMNDMKDMNRAAESSRGQFWGKSAISNEAGDAMQDESIDDDEDDDLLEGCVPRGSYVTLTLANVTPESVEALSDTALLAAVSLLPHENKVSVLHMGLSQSAGCTPSGDVPIKSKDVLTFRCGWRTWKGRPIFSQHNLNCDKHKYERFMPQAGAFFAGSVRGPVTYTPSPVMVFRERAGQQTELVAIGSMIGADADRIVVKRIILTGYPVRVHKRHATVKYMFTTPEDVKWFKPAGLYTKHGLQGNIVQSVGEHGTMKCLFNAPIKQHDTVCLPLYKRIYPKFVTANDEGHQDDKTFKASRHHSLVVR